MSAPLKLTPDALRDIAHALTVLGQVTRDHNVEFGGYGRACITHRDPATGIENVLEMRLTNVTEDDAPVYIIDDEIGG